MATQPNAADAATDQRTGNQIAVLVADASVAVEPINAGLRECSNEYRERIRKLRDAIADLQFTRTTAPGEVIDVSQILTKQVARLIADPMHSL